jgi:hypothetical protein
MAGFPPAFSPSQLLAGQLQGIVQQQPPQIGGLNLNVNPSFALGAGPVGSPVSFSQPDQMVFLTQLLQNLQNVGRGSSVARAFLQSRGVYSSAPLEQPVRVRQTDNDSYFEALGYTA